jgi:hypothetical protein
MLDRFGVRWQSGAATPLFARPPASKKRRGATLPAAVQKLVAAQFAFCPYPCESVSIRGKKSSQNSACFPMRSSANSASLR